MQRDEAVEVKNPCIVQYVKPSARCPVCRKYGVPRSGVGFEGEFRCARGCDVTWVPEESYLLFVTEVRS